MQQFGKAMLFLPLESIESEALTQIRNISELPFIFKHIAVMPDCHVGKGATVGTVIATKGAVIPAAVGVDIGCGMIAVRTDLKRDQLKDLPAIREGIERRVPMSAGNFNTKITKSAAARIGELEALAGGDMDKKFGTKNWRYQLGTLGGGNHFIEICVDKENMIWLTLHSGSRGIGNRIGNHYIKLAQSLMGKMHISLPDRDLAYLPEETEEFHDYQRDLHWGQKFALLNREEMMDRLITEISCAVSGDGRKRLEVERVNCHHNFTQIEHHFDDNVWVTRKGAIQARRGMKGMIPGSMGTKSYIVSGLENAIAFNSAPHGAGRRFSRTKAKQQFTMADLERAMEGKEWRHKKEFIDEIPAAYKDIDEVMENAKDLVTIERTLSQIVNVKGD
jgi:tRNA-splicing ligase RtcB (3'-phosphate/5'-hydroxy nucleic acid ligase)